MNSPATELATIRQAERAARLDDILIRWANLGWGGVNIEHRLPSVSPSCSGFRSSRQWDAAHLDDEDEARAVAALLLVLSELQPLQRLAIHEQARALMLGTSAFKMTRLEVVAREEHLRLARLTATAKLSAMGFID